MPNPYLYMYSLCSLFKFNGQVVSVCHVPGIMQGILETWPHLAVITTLSGEYYHLDLEFDMDLMAPEVEVLTQDYPANKNNRYHLVGSNYAPDIV